MKLTIKDPSFVTIAKKGYIFYMGQVSLQALFGDDETTSKLFHYTNIVTEPNAVGILSRFPTVDTTGVVTGGLKDPSFFNTHS